MRGEMPTTSVIGIVVALISVNVLRTHTELSTPLTWVIAIGAVFLATVVFVFIMGALGKYPPIPEKKEAEHVPRSSKGGDTRNQPALQSRILAGSLKLPRLALRRHMDLILERGNL